MGVIADIAADGDCCQHCGRLLHEYFGGKRTRRLLRLWDGDIVFATIVDITCAWCGAVNSIFYQADMLPNVQPTGRRFRCAPTI